MSESAITSIEETRAKILAQVRSALKMDQEKAAEKTALPTADPAASLEELRAQILQKVKDKLGIITSKPAAAEAAAAVDLDAMRTRMLFSRIKYSNIPRHQRDALSGFVRSISVEGKIDSKFIKTVTEMIFFMEMTSPAGRRAELKTFPLEKTVDEEMKLIAGQRSRREEMQTRLDSLRGKISASA